MQALIYLAVAGFSLLMIVVGIALYTKLTKSGPRFRNVVEHTIREFDPARRSQKGDQQQAPPSDIISYRESQTDTMQSGQMICRECRQPVAAGRFCAQCGSPLFYN